MKYFVLSLLSFPVLVLAEGGLPNQPHICVMGKAEILAREVSVGQPED